MKTFNREAEGKVSDDRMQPSEGKKFHFMFSERKNEIFSKDFRKCCSNAARKIMSSNFRSLRIRETFAESVMQFWSFEFRSSGSLEGIFQFLLEILHLLLTAVYILNPLRLSLYEYSMIHEDNKKYKCKTFPRNIHFSNFSFSLKMQFEICNRFGLCFCSTYTSGIPKLTITTWEGCSVPDDIAVFVSFYLDSYTNRVILLMDFTPFLNVAIFKWNSNCFFKVFRFSRFSVLNFSCAFIELSNRNLLAIFAHNEIRWIIIEAWRRQNYKHLAWLINTLSQT